MSKPESTARSVEVARFMLRAAAMNLAINGHSEAGIKQMIDAENRFEVSVRADERRHGVAEPAR